MEIGGEQTLATRLRAGMKEILLIEDTESDARMLQRTLQIAGVRNPIRHAWTGRDGLRFLEEGIRGSRALPGVLLLDLKLPDMSGFDILARFQYETALAGVLRIVISHLQDIVNIKRAYALGANTFICKPASQEELEELLKVYPGYWDRPESSFVPPRISREHHHKAPAS